MSRRAASRFDGRHALVTGGSSGIGLAIVRRLVGLGARVSVIALEDGDLARLRAEPSRGPHLLYVTAADVADRERVQAAVGSCAERHGPVDLLVTCAGTVHPGYFEKLPDEVLEREMRVDYFGTLWTVRAVLPSMLERREGSIVMISSFAALLGVFGMGAYGPAKYAVRGLGELLRTELKPRGIHVMTVFPTDVDTPGLAGEIPQHPPEQDAMQGKIKPMSPEVVVEAILDGVAMGKPYVYPGRWNATLARVASSTPGIRNRIVDRALAKGARTRERANSDRPSISKRVSGGSEISPPPLRRP